MGSSGIMTLRALVPAGFNVARIQFPDVVREFPPKAFVAKVGAYRECGELLEDGVALTFSPRLGGRFSYVDQRKTGHLESANIVMSEGVDHLRVEMLGWHVLRSANGGSTLAEFDLGRPWVRWSSSNGAPVLRVPGEVL